MLLQLVLVENSKIDSDLPTRYISVNIWGYHKQINYGGNNVIIHLRDNKKIDSLYI